MRTIAHKRAGRVLLLLGAAILASAAFGKRVGAAGISSLLDRYASGQFQSAVDSALGGDWKVTVPALRAGLKRDAPGWAAREGPEREPRRQLIAATFALEVVHGVYADLQQQAGAGPLQDPSERFDFHLTEPWALPGWRETEPLLEWACGRLRHIKTNDPLERDWFIASVQTIRDFHAPAVAVERWNGPYRTYGRTEGHLWDAMSRFPDEPWFRVVIAERQDLAEQTLGKGLVQETVEAAYKGRSWPTAAIGPKEVWATLADLLEMRKGLTPLEPAPSVRAEVHVHLGCIALICGERDKARAYLDDVDPWTKDPCLRYLGHYLRGRADEADGHLPDAERSYRQALAALPGVPSGLTSLATTLALENRGAEAANLARRVFETPPTQLDPLIELWNGTGCTRWPVAIEHLHEGFRVP